MKVKICGLTRPEDADLACRAGAWAVGLIFVPSSPRALTEERARAVRDSVWPGTLSIGVFADRTAEEVERIAELCRLDAVQLHGSETPEYCAAMKLPVYKALMVAESGDLDALARFPGAGCVVETVRRLPSGREELTPTERVRRWELVGHAKRRGLLLLAGGLDALNVKRAVEVAAPDGVDVAGGVESAPGVKDERKLWAFFEAARS